MFPPVNAYMPPPSRGSIPQGAPPLGEVIPQKTAEMNQVVQQMHGMKINETANTKFPGSEFSGCSSLPVDNTNRNSNYGLPSSVGTHPPQNVNRAASATQVTYSPQLRATYPYSPHGSIASNVTPVPNSVPSVKTQSSVGAMPTFNGTSDRRNGVLSGDFCDSPLPQAHLPYCAPSVPPTKQNSPNGLTQYRPPVATLYKPPGAVSDSTSYTSGVHNTQTPYSPVGAPLAHTSDNGPGAANMPSPLSHLDPSNMSTLLSPSGVPSGKILNNTGVSALQTMHNYPSMSSSGPASYNSPGGPHGLTPYSPSGIPTGPAPCVPPGAPGSMIQNVPGSFPYNPTASSSGSTAFSPPSASEGPYNPLGTPGRPYNSPGAPNSPYNSPSMSSRPTPNSAPGIGPSVYAPSGVPPTGPTQYSGPGAPSGPTPYSPLSSPSGPTPYSPHGIPQAQSLVQQQQQRKLELDQMPSTVQVREEDRRNRSGYYPTDTKCVPPPLVTTTFIAQDRGICSPRFMRSTMYCLPNSPEILKQTGVPFAVVVNPMANVCDGENEPPLCMFREEGPLRCKRCKAYMCSFMVFGEGGRCFQCAFCKVATEVPQDYFCYLDGIGQRTDKFHRPELCLGSYEFIATKDYCKNGEVPNTPAYIFMIEVSKGTLDNGMVQLLCKNMKSILAALHGDEKKSTSAKVGFVTYNNVLHFYNLKKSLSQPHIMVMPDVHDAFVPLMDGFLVSLSEAETLIDCLMEHIPQMYTNEPSGEVLFGPVVQAGLEALKNANCAGKLLVFHSTLPTCEAPGKLQKRDGQKLLGTEKQKSVLTPQNPLYSKLAEDCVAAGCCVDLFLFPNDYIDVATMSQLCRHTGGHINRYMYFQAHVDGTRFLEDLERNVTTSTAFDAVLRIRTSAGISPVFHYGNFFMSNTTDIEISALNCYKAATVEFAYDEKLAENDTVYIQAALLYTTCNGDRRIRVNNLALSTSTSVADMYRGCELDTIGNFLSKQVLKQIFDQPPQQSKSALASRAVKMLAGYRKHCSSASASSQLILPETLKLLPLYMNCMLKSDALTGGPEISLDDRSFAILTLNGMSVENSAFYFYPTLISLHDLDVNSDEMPVPIRCSMEKMNASGAYLLTNGIYMFLWISQGISSEWVSDVFGVQSPSAIDKQQTSLMELDTPLSKRIRHIIEDLEEKSVHYMRLNIVLQGDKLEIVFRQFLVEDRGVDGSPSYVEFLCHLHNEITKLL